MLRAEVDETPACIALPLKEEEGAKADADATIARKAEKVFILQINKNCDPINEKRFAGFHRSIEFMVADAE